MINVLIVTITCLVGVIGISQAVYNILSVKMIGYAIRPNEHYSVFRLDLESDRKIKGSAMFNDSCKYELKSNFGQINKLIGLHIGLFGIHENSLRIGWVFKNGIFYLYAYYYIGGERYSELIQTVSPNVIFNYEIEIKDFEYFIRINNYCWSINTDVYSKGSKLQKTYVTFPYFGGKVPNPNDRNMVVGLKIDEIENDVVRKLLKNKK